MTASAGDTPELSRSSATSTPALRFAVDAALLFQLGEQLVARSSIALAELIKNAYDADATHVYLTFRDVRTPRGTLEIADDGLGMTFEEVQDGWMRIATTRKVNDPYTPKYRRHKTGAKGVGRFAAHKLARQLLLRSVAQRGDSKEEVKLAIDWDLFKPGLDLDSLAFTCERRPVPETTATGVTLTLTELRRPWSKQDLAEVRDDLQDLLSPFPRVLPDRARRTSAPPEEDPGFRATIEAPEFPEYEGALSERFLSAAWAKLVAIVDTDATPRYRLEIRGEENQLAFHPADATLPTIVGAEVTIHFFIYEQRSLVGTSLRLGQLRDLGRRYGGVKVYQDGFRVFPYGDPGDDWLHLDEDRARRLTRVDALLRDLVPSESTLRPMLGLPGNNQLFGAVHVSRSAHPELTPTISRERFLENEAFDELRGFVRLGIDWATVQRARREASPTASHRSTASSTQPPRKASEVVQETVASVKDQLVPLTTVHQREPIVTELDQMAASVLELEQEQISKLAMLRVLASAGTMVLMFVHQIRAMLDGLRRLTREFGDVGSPLSPRFFSNLDATRRRLMTWTRMMDAPAQELGALLGAEARSRRRSLAVQPVVEQVRSAFELYCTDHGITFENAVASAMRTPPLYEAELHSLLLNALSNSLKAVKDSPIRRVEVDATVEDRTFRLLIRDTGRGIDPELRERVFRPFETTSDADPILGTGTGMGLTIIEDIALEHNGTATFIEPSGPWRTCLQISIPYGIDQR